MNIPTKPSPLVPEVAIKPTACLSFAAGTMGEHPRCSVPVRQELVYQAKKAAEALIQQLTTEELPDFVVMKMTIERTQ